MTKALLWVLEWSQGKGSSAKAEDGSSWIIHWMPHHERHGHVELQLWRAPSPDEASARGDIGASLMHTESKGMKTVSVAVWAQRLMRMPTVTDLGFAALHWGHQRPNIAWVRSCHYEEIAQRWGWEIPPQ